MILNIKFDEEQQKLIYCNDPLLVGEAFAGAGKTTVAVAYALHRPHERIIYLCLGKANQMEAQQRFPKNVSCVTSHAVAFRAVGRFYSARLAQPWKAKHVAEDLGVNIRKASIVHAVILSFLASGRSSVSYEDMVDAIVRYDIPSVMVDELLAISQRFWERMRDPNDSVKINADAYLKVWSLSKPQLNYDCIILDEAQDSNPAVTEVVLSQKKARVLMIGDRHQSIYGFRGAVNAMEQMACAGGTVVKMPRTWRFGDRTAMLANALLGVYKKEKTKIIGMGQDAEYQDGQHMAYISRTNSQLFSMAAQRKGMGIHWVGGAKNYRLELVLDAYHLSVGKREKINDMTLRRYASWSEYVSEFEISKDGESKILIDAVAEYGDAIPELISCIYMNEEIKVSDSDRSLTTAHKSKGFEWDFVKIGDDFTVYESIEKVSKTFASAKPELIQDVNLLYVLMTRAKKKVFLNEDSKRMFTMIKAGTPALVKGLGK